MYNDPLQGILFNKSTHLNLAGPSLQARFRQTVIQSNRIFGNEPFAGIDIIKPTISTHSTVKQPANAAGLSSKLDSLQRRLKIH